MLIRLNHDMNIIILYSDTLPWLQYTEVNCMRCFKISVLGIQTNIYHFLFNPFHATAAPSMTVT
jgi:hypothetical protein